MTVLLLLYHTSMIRANRFVMKAMLGEPLSAPAPNVETQVFGIRDLYDSTTSPKQVRDSIGHMNFYFHGCRIQAVKSANSLCHLVQAAYACKFNFYTLGSPIIFSIFELMVVHISFLRSRDSDIGWRAKSRLANIFNILRMLRHWAPALHTFVAGIRCLSDPTLCLDNPPNMSKLRNGMIDASMLAMTDMPANSGETSDEDAGGNEPESKRRRRAMSRGTALDSLEDARKNIETSTAPLGSQQPVDVKRDETLSYNAADPIPEFPNPYPPNHVITLIIKDLGLSLAEFLAPSYPILLLKLIPIRAFVPGQSAAGLFGGVSKPSS
ncbi:hypothetical protein EC988_005015 [Linderina pennispora]|nr:hypothetical protein EC988_005015 [Linderina pennispora]